jgi:antitoxin (DNA-binding transcriptional repressor) of toxin-antitoxin stability system
MRESLFDIATAKDYVSGMKSVDVKRLKHELSEYIRLANAGETVLVTDNEKVVARIIPPAARDQFSLANRVLPEAVQKGWLTPPLAHLSGAPPAPAPVAPLRELLAELDDDRGDC